MDDILIADDQATTLTLEDEATESDISEIANEFDNNKNVFDADLRALQGQNIAIRRDLCDTLDVITLLAKIEYRRWREVYEFFLYIFILLALIEALSLFSAMTSVYTTMTDCFLIGVKCALYVWASFCMHMRVNQSIDDLSIAFAHEEEDISND